MNLFAIGQASVALAEKKQLRNSLQRFASDFRGVVSQNPFHPGHRLLPEILEAYADIPGLTKESASALMKKLLPMYCLYLQRPIPKGA